MIKYKYKYNSHTIFINFWWNSYLSTTINNQYVLYLVRQMAYRLYFSAKPDVNLPAYTYFFHLLSSCEQIIYLLFELYTYKKHE